MKMGELTFFHFINAKINLPNQVVLMRLKTPFGTDMSFIMENIEESLNRKYALENLLRT